MPIRFCARALACAIAAVAVAAQPAAAEDKQPGHLEYQSMAQAFANGVANDKVTVLVFGAEWCTACKKLEHTVLNDPDIRKAGSAMTWSKIDIDKNPSIAAMFDVRAVPTIIFLNNKGEPLHTTSGLVSAQRLTGLLNDYADKATQAGTMRGRHEQLLELVAEATRIAEGEDVPADTVLRIVELIAVPDPIGADETRHRLVAMGPGAWRGLVEALGHRKLAVRAAAYDLLKETTGQVIPYDPFLDPKERAGQAKAWRDWLDSVRPERAAPKPAPQDNAGTLDGEEEGKTAPRAPR